MNIARKEVQREKVWRCRETNEDRVGQLARVGKLAWKPREEGGDSNHCTTCANRSSKMSETQPIYLAI